MWILPIYKGLNIFALIFFRECSRRKSFIFQLKDQSNKTADKHTSIILCPYDSHSPLLQIAPEADSEELPPLLADLLRTENFFCVRRLSAIHATQIAAKQAPRIKREFRYAKRILNGLSESLAGRARGKEKGRSPGGGQRRGGHATPK